MKKLILNTLITVGLFIGCLSAKAQISGPCMSTNSAYVPAYGVNVLTNSGAITAFYKDRVSVYTSISIVGTKGQIGNFMTAFKRTYTVVADDGYVLNAGTQYYKDIVYVQDFAGCIE